MDTGKMKLEPIAPLCANLTEHRSVSIATGGPPIGWEPTRGVSAASLLFNGRLMIAVRKIFDERDGFTFRVENGGWDGSYDLQQPNQLVCHAPRGAEVHQCEPFQVVVPGSLTTDECAIWYTGNIRTPEQYEQHYRDNPHEYIPY